ncbi:uncharacterized protein [Physcomitrium patens]|uniref:DUF924 domain-containing protein n=1 Tax=Physcomitrium patens TaxID=3218 RepID=A0A2K1K2N4_PHYPA|nr:uncharacterized protein LOC112287091 isoform X2 [Physcomitrium patens]PNR48034.1 hypothetical protein PHYPA_012507 [Physcomitrium patens]|eukprot:XP_024385515.1 uncharacterized protein LOC112287091 isoform X2 [Physcomitrella patens]
MARMMLKRFPLTSSSHPLGSQHLVQSVLSFVTPNFLHNHFSAAPPCPARCPLNAPLSNICCISTILHVTYTRPSLQPSLLRSTLSERRGQVNRRTFGRFWKAVTLSGFSTDAAHTENMTPEDVLHYWFKDADLASNEFPNKFWFFGGEAVDKEIKEKFGECLQRAIRGDLDHWKSTPRGRVALVLVLDQFSRNCFRDSSRAFAQDDTALKLTVDTIDQGLDQQLSNPLERYFLYMPLMHSESLEVHAIAHRMFQKLTDDHKDNPELYKFFQDVVKFEIAHSSVLAKFGRYPSRNAILGRSSTTEEEKYLAAGVLWPMED